MIGVWPSGKAQGFGPWIAGSNPATPAIKKGTDGKEFSNI